MPIDVTELMKKREMIDSIIRLASDPETAVLLEQLIVNRSDDTSVGGATTAYDAVHSDPHPSRILPNMEDQKQKTAGVWGMQTAAIRSVIVAQSGMFTVSVIADVLRGQGMAINKIAVGQTLQRLMKAAEIRLVVRGEGREPHRYEKTDKLRGA